MAWEPFRLVYRSFARIEFDPDKSAEVLRRRAFDLPYVAPLFPGYVLERPDPRSYNEIRYQAIGDIGGDVVIVVYTVRTGDTCRLITAWRAGAAARRIWNER